MSELRDDSPPVYRWGGFETFPPGPRRAERVCAPEGLAWTERGPFGLPGVDVRPVTQGRMSATGDLAAAERFGALREADGLAHVGHIPEGARAFDCDLEYPELPWDRRGALFVARVMEERWDLYQWGEHLYFADAWSGALQLRADIEPSGEGIAVRRVLAAEEEWGAAPYPARLVDYLLRSHALDEHCPTPLPASMPHDPAVIGLHAFERFGRMAWFATFEDTTRRPGGEPGALVTR